MESNVDSVTQSTPRSSDITYSISWNMLLIVAGAVLFATSMKGIALQHQFVSGGLFGLSLLLHYATSNFSAGVFYFCLNIALFFVGWRYIRKGFVLYSLLAMVVTSVSFEVIQVDFGIQNQLYAAVACGVLGGFGAGLVLRSLGSNGGLDVIAVFLFQKFNLGIGKVYFMFNGVLFLFALVFVEIDLVIVSLIMVFVSANVVEYTLALFNQRKLVFIISNQSKRIVQSILERLKLGATYLSGKGAYSGADKEIVMTVINNIQLKKLEEIVFTEDENALFIVENTFNVLGSSFCKRKLY